MLKKLVIVVGVGGGKEMGKLLGEVTYQVITVFVCLYNLYFSF